MLLFPSVPYRHTLSWIIKYTWQKLVYHFPHLVTYQNFILSIFAEGNEARKIYATFIPLLTCGWPQKEKKTSLTKQCYPSLTGKLLGPFVWGVESFKYDWRYFLSFQISQLGNEIGEQLGIFLLHMLAITILRITFEISYLFFA